MADVSPRQQRILDELKSGALYSGKLVERVEEGPYSMSKDTLYKELKELERQHLIRSFKDESRNPPRTYYETVEKTSDYRSGSGAKQTEDTPSDVTAKNITKPDINSSVSNAEVNVFVDTRPKETHQPISDIPRSRSVNPDFNSEKFTRCLKNHLKMTKGDFDFDINIDTFKQENENWFVKGTYNYISNIEEYRRLKKKANTSLLGKIMKQSDTLHEEANAYYHWSQFRLTYDVVPDRILNYDERYNPDDDPIVNLYEKYG